MIEEDKIRKLPPIDLKNHAYLVEVDDLYSTELILNLIKDSLKNTFDIDTSKKIINLINNGSFSDLKIIRPSGKYIKKEQLVDVMSEFKNSSLYNWKKIYIIEYAENLNLSSGNTILKFLEEPVDDIVAILITKNIKKVLPTIVSRCFIISDNKYRIKEFTNEKIQASISFIYEIEVFKGKSSAYLNNLYLLESQDLKEFFQIALLIYDDVLNYIKLDEVKNFVKFKNDIIMISQKTKIHDIIKKIKQINQILNYLDYNINSRILLDLFLIGEKYE